MARPYARHGRANAGRRALPLLIVAAPLVLTLIATPSAASEPGSGMLVREAHSAQGFVPTGWAIERRVQGDLDGKGRADLVLVIRMRERANLVANEGLGEPVIDTNPRVVLVALAKPGGGYRVVAEGHGLIPRREVGAMADFFAAEESELAIAQRVLRISLHRFMTAGGWDMGNHRFRFRWQDGVMRLIGFDYDNVQRNTGCTSSVSVNYLTGRMRVASGRVDDEREQVGWSRIDHLRAPDLGAIANGLEFDPQRTIERFPLTCTMSR